MGKKGVPLYFWGMYATVEWVEAGVFTDKKNAGLM